MIRLKTLKHYQSILKSSKPSLKQLNHIVSECYRDKGTVHYLGDDGVTKAEAAIDDLNCNSDNCIGDDDFHKEDHIIRQNIKLIKKSKSRWFMMIQNHLTPKKRHEFFNCSYSYRAINRDDVIKLVQQIINQKTKMTDKQCAQIILKWIESFSDDDVASDAVKLIKPYAILANEQLIKDHDSMYRDSTKPHSCGRALLFFVDWFDSFSEDTYVPKHKGKVYCLVPNKKYKDIIDQLRYAHHEDKIETIPAQHDEISVDAMQQFLRPWAYMFASVLHTQVHFPYVFFS